MFDEPRPSAGALAGIRVLDVTNELAAYASRLLGDLGAEVIRIEPPGGSRSRHTGPIVAGNAGAATDVKADVSAFDRFVNAGKRSVVLDLAVPTGRQLFLRLAERSDVLFETWSQLEAERLGLTPRELAAVNQRLVHVSVTPFGRDRPRIVVDDDDLTILAAGGLLTMGGYPDSPPLAAEGGQSRNAASIFAAVGAVVALYDRVTSSTGHWVDVSAQECVAQALEDSLASYEMTGHVRKRHGSTAAEAGTGMYPCADGLVSMVAGRVGTARAWQALVAWLGEAGVDGADQLSAPEWSDLTFRQTKRAIAVFGDVFSRFAQTRSKLDLYREAQKRGIALSPVNDIAGVLADPQLTARGFWVNVPDRETGREVIYPGPPYRLSRTPALAARPSPELGADTSPVLRELLGLDSRQLEGLREAGIS
jgi:benzylsuccinate CoA-transferase BbsE subunit